MLRFSAVPSLLHALSLNSLTRNDLHSVQAFVVLTLPWAQAGSLLFFLHTRTHTHTLPLLFSLRNTEESDIVTALDLMVCDVKLSFLYWLLSLSSAADVKLSFLHWLLLLPSAGRKLTFCPTQQE